MRGPIPEQQAPTQQQIKEEPYEEDYETQYRQQAANSGFRGHSPVREVRKLSKEKNLLALITALI